ncbi:wobble nucleotide-excising tRNase [Xenorhabdus cabanillasii]|uniref:Wobble nucleotide-excising tRNase n=1 Tax=Xenorhabdus cabanillasii TaxID=351673 RepID=A0A3D9UPW5_9GAMM|nr:AAA family ATPase [Xenorhabdus cabanillasii]REF28695.1 wobble nucleotide-excising tRNase [Xenorhabdus cabanillasii]
MAILTLKGVKSYSADKEVTIDFSNPITLIYGQNGSGKSTISGYFTGYHPEEYKNCYFQSDKTFDFLVFNQEYVEKKFRNEKYQPGIFTLNEKNDDFNTTINDNNKRITQIEEELDVLNTFIQDRETARESFVKTCIDNIFDKTVNERKSLEYFLDGAKQRNTFYNRMKNTSPRQTTYTTEALTSKLQQLLNSKGTRYNELNEPAFQGLSEDIIDLMATPLMPASNTQFSAFIQDLGNADWLRRGTEYVRGDVCPFCHQEFNSQHILEEVARMFDQSYEQSIAAIHDAKTAIARDIEKLDAFREQLKNHPVVVNDSAAFGIVKSLQQLFHANIQAITYKIEHPSKSIKPDSTNELSQKLVDNLNTLNDQIQESNRLASNFDIEMELLNDEVLSYLRNNCEPYFSNCELQVTEAKKQIKNKNIEVSSLMTEKQKLEEENHRLTGQMSVIQPTIDTINNNLILLGINDFNIICHDEEFKLYRLQRRSRPKDNDVFKSLSEGEKTIIAFLYFIEFCSGHTMEQGVTNSKLVVIDDPISSLSHNFIYEVASLIKRKFITAGLASHLVILTHNIFFFQEILLSSVRRLDQNATTPKNWSLLRIVKGHHSDCVTLSMHEMLNEYQALWQTLKDVKDGRCLPVVLLNTMRNILEYYFSFACKQEKLGHALEKLAQEHSAGEYDSFYRAINRHSHSGGRNIQGTGIIDVSNYFRLFRKIFEATEDIEHHDTMMGIRVPKPQ